jgi:hypothetical protein
MISALVFLYSRSLANRLRRQCARLKRPKYLAGALVGGAYVWFFFLRPFLFSPSGSSPRAATTWLAEGVERSLLELGGAFALALFVLAGWLFPKGRAALDFTEAEIAFLFPAPVPRRTLIHGKLLKSQLRIAFSALFMTIFSARGAATPAWMHWIGWWLVFSTMELHLLGASFTRTRWLDRGVARGWQRLAVLGVVAVLGAVVLGWAWTSLPAFSLEALTDRERLTDYAQRAAASGPVPWILLPFRLLVRPMLAVDARQFGLAAAPALGLFVLNYLWVVCSDVSFEEASLARAQQRARTMAAMRSGQWQLAGQGKRRVAPLFALRPGGGRMVALLWKNLIAAAGVVSLRFWAVAGVILFIGAAVLKTVGPGSAVLQVFGAVLLGLTPLVLLVGTQLVPFDFRQDLGSADLLKTYPLRGWQVALGELLAPTVLLTAAQWFLIALAVVLLPAPRGQPILGLADRLAWGAGLGLLVPFLNLSSLLLINAGVLWFPSWTRTGPGRAEGFEAMGQRMLFMLAQMLGLVFVLLLPALVFAGVFLVGRLWLSLMMVVPLAAAGAALVLAGEAAAGVVALGRLFEKLDVSDELLS